MKNRYLIPSLLLLFCSCSDFLKEASKDQIIPKTVRDYSEFIFGEVYNKQNSSAIHAYLDIMTDDCKDFRHTSNGLLASDERLGGWGYWTWQQDPEMPWEGVLKSDPAWGHYYHQILACNIVFDALERQDVPGDEQERIFLQAECHLIRANAYFMLVNLYGEPHDDAPEKAMGVPINDLVGASNKNFSRASVADIYKVIRSDIAAALSALKAAPGDGSIFRWNYPAACLLASRVALYTRQWEEAAAYAGEVIAIRPELWNLETKKNHPTLSGSRFISKDNPEILFSHGYYLIPYFASGAVGCFQASDDLRALYIGGDLRFVQASTAATSTGAFVRLQGSSSGLGAGLKTLPYKSAISTTTGAHGFSLRVAEAYLNRAEARANLPGQEERALQDLNTLRENRFTAATFVPLTGANGNILQLVKDERRRELCFEQSRWFDLRRWDRPRIAHTFQPDRTAGSTVHAYVLEKDDPAYTLPAPTSVMNLDPYIGNPSRPERVQTTL
ncbi:MAG: RagB/SusD family nutrient uptake outer membrane protein [Odoribacteraceae bacterium]|jgi:hypothetical protein|nr:RagB/SusD family nutrient uptake outer membrane protein [Odoribacteraceae bacterium]